ncbi:hypothetical protein BJX68DRAFT_270328 [Aspergillus pseudodeflectus]|uniref:Uncharacterized protein n=1 Tax=Aspergillus pseudodeflectus TaxID=176178 RepID=A0ABR4JSI4_9EURO
MKITGLLATLAALAPALTEAYATDIYSACQAPRNGFKKAGNGCTWVLGYSDSSTIKDGTCWSGSAIGNGLYCSPQPL